MADGGKGLERLERRKGLSARLDGRLKDRVYRLNARLDGRLKDRVYRLNTRLNSRLDSRLNDRIRRLQGGEGLRSHRGRLRHFCALRQLAQRSTACAGRREVVLSSWMRSYMMLWALKKSAHVAHNKTIT